MQAKYCPIDAIKVNTRQRKERPEKHIQDLAADIRTNGLIHAVSLDIENNLVAGWCRLEALKLIKEPYHYGGEMVPDGSVPFVLTHLTDPRDLFRFELMENIRRKGLSPMDEAKAVAELHRLYQVHYGLDWSKGDTGIEVSKIKGTPPPARPDHDVSDSILINSFAGDKDVEGAKTREAAVRIAKKKMQQQLTASLGALSKQRQTDMVLHLGDCKQFMPVMDKGLFSGIIADPPYGIDADTFGEQSMATGHEYEDTKVVAFEVAEAIFFEGNLLCKDDAHLYMFCDLRFFTDLKTLALHHEWHPFATPLIWHKPDGGHAPWPGYFSKHYECILFAQKGTRRLAESRSDVFTFSGVQDKVNAAEKPADLLRALMQLSFFPGESVLDPCCGRGTSFLAAHPLKLKVTGIELDSQQYNIAKGTIAGLGS